jgi:predicted RND superfamily exporter protein
MDIRMLVPLVILVVLSVLLLSFRRGIAIVLPLVTVLIATIWSVGAMPLVGVKMSVLSTVLPVILVAVGSAYGIHVVSHYVDEREVAGDLSREEHRRLVIELTRRIGKPVFLAALTTFVGFVSFCVTAVPRSGSSASSRASGSSPRSWCPSPLSRPSS